MKSDFIHISQGGSMVLEYAVLFNEISRFAEQYVFNEQDKAGHF